MARGGFRPGAGRPKGVKETAPRRRRGTGPGRKGVVPEDIRLEAAAAGLTPLDYMLAVLNDETADPAWRDRMAIAAAPFVHPRADTVAPGKRARRELEAETAERGKRGKAC